MSRDDDLRLRPGRIRQGPRARAKPFVAQALKAANRAGGLKTGDKTRSDSTGNFGRGRAASLRAGRGLDGGARRVTVKARVVRQLGRSATLATHLAYLRRDGVTRDGAPGRLFDADGEDVDAAGFAGRCTDDRHHFRFIVAPEDATDLSDLRTYTRDLMATAETDLGTRLDWVAVDHWNTEHPHIHVLVRGRTDADDDLVISRDYIGQGLRARAAERATLELGPRSAREIDGAIAREVDADRWTGLDRQLERNAVDGIVDLRPRLGDKHQGQAGRLIGRARHLERLGLADPAGSGRWQLADDLEPRLRLLQRQGDIIARLHDALGWDAEGRGTTGFVPHGEMEKSGVLGRLVARGLDDELSGSAFLVIDGVDGRTHHVALPDLDAASDAPIGAIVEARWTQPPRGHSRLVVEVRSDLDLAAQITAPGATWLDRQLVGTASADRTGTGFGRDVTEALTARTDHLVRDGRAFRDKGRLRIARNLLETLRTRELEAAAARIANETGLTALDAPAGASVSGVLKRRVILASGRFAMLDSGLGFQLVPWSPALARRMGQEVSGIVRSGGGIDWSLGRQRGPSR